MSRAIPSLSTTPDLVPSLAVASVTLRTGATSRTGEAILVDSAGSRAATTEFDGRVTCGRVPY